MLTENLKFYMNYCTLESGGDAEHPDGVIMVTAWTSVSVVDIGRHTAGSDDLQRALPKVAAQKSEISDKMFCICFLHK